MKRPEGQPLEAHRISLLKYALVLTRDFPRAEDLVQRTFERALARGEDAPKLGWLRVTMKNLFIDDTRRASVHERVVQTQSELLDLNYVEVDIGVFDSRQRLTAALRQLAPEMAQTLLLVVVEGWTYAEVAEAQGVKLGTVKSRIARARQALARILTSDEGER